MANAPSNPPSANAVLESAETQATAASAETPRNAEDNFANDPVIMSEELPGEAWFKGWFRQGLFDQASPAGEPGAFPKGSESCKALIDGRWTLGAESGCPGGTTGRFGMRATESASSWLWIAALDSGARQRIESRRIWVVGVKNGDGSASRHAKRQASIRAPTESGGVRIALGRPRFTSQYRCTQEDGTSLRLRSRGLWDDVGSAFGPPADCRLWIA